MGGITSNPDVNFAYKVAKNTLRYALVNFSVLKLKSQKSIIATLPVEFSATDYEVDIKMTRDLSSLIYSGTDIEKDIEFVTHLEHDKLKAPIEEGQVVGKIRAYYNNNLIDECDLVIDRTIDSHGFLVFMYYMKKLTQNPLFIIPFLAVCGLLVYWKIKSADRKKCAKRRKRRYY